jgi:hypothetical protein
MRGSSTRVWFAHPLNITQQFERCHWARSMTVNESKEMAMSDYRQRERALLEQFALGVLADPKASIDDKREARTRLEGGRKRDLSALSDHEVAIYEHLLLKLAGHAASAYELANLEHAARAVADDAKTRVDAEQARLAELADERTAPAE